jgi:hypothetical protein
MEQPPNAVCIYSSRMVKNYRICPIRIGIIHGRHRVVQFTHGLGLYILRFYRGAELSNIISNTWTVVNNRQLSLDMK